MRSITTIAAFCALLYLSEAQRVEVSLQCKPTGYQCVNETTFIICADIGNGVLVPTPFFDNCPEGYLCDDNQQDPCVEKTTMTSTTEAASTTTKSTSTLPPNIEIPFACTKPGKFPAKKCNKYISCTKIGSWMVQKEKCCLFGSWFNAVTQRCVRPEYSGCIPK